MNCRKFNFGRNHWDSFDYIGIYNCDHNNTNKPWHQQQRPCCLDFELRKCDLDDMHDFRGKFSNDFYTAYYFLFLSGTCLSFQRYLKSTLYVNNSRRILNYKCRKFFTKYKILRNRAWIPEEQSYAQTDTGFDLLIPIKAYIASLSLSRAVNPFQNPILPQVKLFCHRSRNGVQNRLRIIF